MVQFTGITKYSDYSEETCYIRFFHLNIHTAIRQYKVAGKKLWNFQFRGNPF